MVKHPETINGNLLIERHYHPSAEETLRKCQGENLSIFIVVRVQ